MYIIFSQTFDKSGNILTSLYALSVSRTHFQSESALYSCLNVKELLARNRRDIWSLNDSNWSRTHYHLVRKLILNHLAKLAIWLSCIVSTYLYGVFESRCSHLNFRYRACFKQEVPWHSGNYRVWIHSETNTWHNKNIQSNLPHRKLFTRQLDSLIQFG